MELKLSELQKITLRDILITTGLTERQVEDVFLLLSLKREKVQLAFYYRAQGMTFGEISRTMDSPPRTVYDWVNSDCCDVGEYLRIFPQKP